MGRWAGGVEPRKTLTLRGVTGSLTAEKGLLSSQIQMDRGREPERKDDLSKH